MTKDQWNHRKRAIIHRLRDAATDHQWEEWEADFRDFLFELLHDFKTDLQRLKRNVSSLANRVTSLETPK